MLKNNKIISYYFFYIIYILMQKKTKKILKLSSLITGTALIVGLPMVTVVSCTTSNSGDTNKTTNNSNHNTSSSSNNTNSTPTVTTTADPYNSLQNPNTINSVFTGKNAKTDLALQNEVIADTWTSSGCLAFSAGQSYTFSQIMQIIGSWSNLLNVVNFPPAWMLKSSWYNQLSTKQQMFYQITANYAMANVQNLTLQEQYQDNDIMPYASAQIQTAIYLIMNLFSEISGENATGTGYSLLQDGLSSFSSLTATVPEDNGMINMSVVNSSFNSFFNLMKSWVNDASGGFTNFVTIQYLLSLFLPWIPNNEINTSYLTNQFQYYNTWLLDYQNISNQTVPNLVAYSFANNKITLTNTSSTSNNSSWLTNVLNIYSPFTISTNLLDTNTISANSNYTWLNKNQIIYGTQNNPIVNFIVSNFAYNADNQGNTYALLIYFLLSNLQGTYGNVIGNTILNLTDTNVNGTFNDPWFGSFDTQLDTTSGISYVNILYNLMKNYMSQLSSGNYFAMNMINIMRNSLSLSSAYSNNNYNILPNMSGLLAQMGLANINLSPNSNNTKDIYSANDLSIYNVINGGSATFDTPVYTNLYNQFLDYETANGFNVPTFTSYSQYLAQLEAVYYGQTSMFGGGSYITNLFGGLFGVPSSYDYITNIYNYIARNNNSSTDSSVINYWKDYIKQADNGVVSVALALQNQLQTLYNNTSNHIFMEIRNFNGVDPYEATSYTPVYLIINKTEIPLDSSTTQYYDMGGFSNLADGELIPNVTTANANQMLSGYYNPTTGDVTWYYVTLSYSPDISNIISPSDLGLTFPTSSTSNVVISQKAAYFNKIN